jgi:hypothetical protein
MALAAVITWLQRNVTLCPIALLAELLNEVLLQTSCNQAMYAS